MSAEVDYAAVVANWPPLTQEQKDRIRGILKPDYACPPSSEAPRRPVVEVKTALYRHYDDEGELLYIGISNDLKSRTRSHLRGSAFSRFVVRSEAEHFVNRALAEDAEKLAIEEERPLFNVTHNQGHGAEQRLTQYLIKRGALDLLGPKKRVAS